MTKDKYRSTVHGLDVKRLAPWVQSRTSTLMFGKTGGVPPRAEDSKRIDRCSSEAPSPLRSSVTWQRCLRRPSSTCLDSQSRNLSKFLEQLHIGEHLLCPNCAQIPGPRGALKSLLMLSISHTGPLPLNLGEEQPHLPPVSLCDHSP